VLRPASPAVPIDGTVLVRLSAPDRSWARRLPPVPADRTLTVTVGHPALLPVPVDDLIAGGYRIVGVAAAHRPVGRTVDVLVPADLHRDHPTWWRELQRSAERVFDLRHGPVQRVLAAELDLHLRESAVS
jgi:hypothetical protein